MSGNRRPTIKTVAARAGVGRTTVSRVVNGSDLVSDDAREQVLAAIKELNYVPNSVARGLVTNRTNAVALVIPESESRLGSEPFFAALIRGVSGALAESRTQLQLMLVRDQAERDQLTETVAAHRVDGVLLVSVHADDRLPGMLEEMGLPTVLAGRRDAGERLSYVNSDNAGGATAAVRHLLHRGRTRIATITGPLDMDVGRSRLAGWRTAHREAGVAADELLVEEGTSRRRVRAGRCVRYLNARRISTPCSPRPTSWRWGRWPNCGGGGCGCRRMSPSWGTRIPSSPGIRRRR
ncbi:hypothetical protein SHKM778_55610 [Streptomyces sp. KM77-8]|uniref:HTH lacI-type domain-containing protein n=1 Tax=Streptomyces haneummycinicus TaxID=3074435 RepID=A0AAT9HNZ2_9ACTN